MKTVLSRFAALVLTGLLAALSIAAEPQRTTGDVTNGAEKRVALVIGNAAYPGAGALRNPANDARDFAGKLRRLGFDVMVRTDVRQKEMLRALTEFGDRVQSGSEALFFYAGHGMQVRGRNYLIPIDAEIRNESSVSSEAVDVDQLLDKLAPARLSMVILDACRNNPFERRFRGGGQGLAQINAPTGTLIAYATAPGKVHVRVAGRHGCSGDPDRRRLQTRARQRRQEERRGPDAVGIIFAHRRLLLHPGFSEYHRESTGRCSSCPCQG